jgi:hypothetical protein
MQVEEIIEELEKTDDDNRRFALLLIVAQLIKKEQLNEFKKSKELSARLFNGITPHFLARLITSNQPAPANCSTLIFKSIALSILVQFTEYESLVCDPIIITKVKHIFETLRLCIDTLTTTRDQCDTSEDHQDLTNLEVNLIDNIFKYLFALSHYCGNHLCKNDLIDLLLNHIVLNEQLSKDHGQYIDIAVQLLISLAIFDQNNNYECRELFCAFLKDFVQKIDANQCESKFKLIKVLNSLLSNWPSGFVHFNAILDDLRLLILKILSDTLKSRIKTTYRQESFVLLDIYTEKYGLDNLYRSSKEFFHLIVHLVSIEICLGLEDNTRSLVDTLNDKQLLCQITVCFNLFEKFILFLSTSDCIDDTTEDDHQLNKITSAFIDTVKSLLVFLNDCLKANVFAHLQSNMFLIASVRIVGCWFAHEDLLENEIVQFVDDFVRLSASTKKSDSMKINGLNEECFVNLNKFLLPGLRRFTDKHTLANGTDDGDADTKDRLDDVREAVRFFEENIS